MAGRRGRKRQKSSAETLKDNRRVSSSLQDPPTESDLPTELLELIFSQLNLRENIRASAVCKKWLAIAISLRKPNKPPLLMSFPKSGDLYEFYDPSNREKYFLEFPELHGTRICHSKDGWLLVFRPRDRFVYFFHPYTRELINLPEKQLAHQVVAFSAVPTSSSCVVFTIKKISPTVFVVGTCHPGATGWSTRNYQSQSPFVPFVDSIWNKIVYCKGVFYCFSVTGWLGVYDADKRTLGISSVPPPKCTEYFHVNHWRRGIFMAEHNGDIFVVYTCPDLSPFIYKLDEIREAWLEIRHLGPVTFFANSLSSIARTDFHGKMRSSVYFSKVLFHGKRCVTYSPDNARYYPRKQNYDWGEEDSGESIWIDAPDDLSTILQRELMIANYHTEDDKMCHQHHHHHHDERENIHPSSRMSIPPDKHLFLQGVNCNGDSGVVLYTYAKPRLKWTLDLNERFIEAVTNWVEQKKLH